MSRSEPNFRQYQVTYHHIIPKSLLKRFWNKVACYHHGYLIGLVEILGDMAPYYAFWLKKARVSDTQTWLHFIINPESLEGVRSSGEAQESWDALKAAYLWMPGNVVKGPQPQQRVNDPGNRLDIDVCWYHSCLKGSSICNFIAYTYQAIDQYMETSDEVVLAAPWRD
ncbi:unnamed protein product [Vitrella brassicaformis CCMP3155]|uniref:Uncharacterized protein n=1 Tax=Vitrella brassicaformis (strain CCMP3155) TaxID=1169540 RepID=A0A0G4GJ47_VITBC|nr:unnamed protein product [Vitrella brassicaformis CCMP3155]|eukprot:CEM29778.1 unnamed protein product [Vitrella brassicaformis CCMP3155]